MCGSGRHIVFYHLLNDFSGSPKVLAGVIEQALLAGHSVELYTSAGGPLDSLSHPALKRHVIPYRFEGRSVATVLRFIGAQIRGFFSVLRYRRRREAEIYVNTILPVGAALGAWLARMRLTVHCHEDVKGKSLTYRLLARMVLPLADKVVCVSRWQSVRLPRGLKKVEIRPNTLPSHFISQLRCDPAAAFEKRNVLMISSLKAYKGIPEFIQLASMLPQYKFTLVAAATRQEIDRWLAKQGLSPGPNVSIFPRSAEVAQFYNDASIVVNLSDTGKFLETCGMTALEARAARLPVIVPRRGGIAEMITVGVDGLHIDSHDSAALSAAVARLLTDRPFYLQLSYGNTGTTGE